MTPRWFLAVALVALVSPLSASTGYQGPTPQAPATGLIVGQVIDAVTGQPVGDSVVTLNSPGTSGSAGRGGGRGSAPKILTDSTGRFLFRGAAKGTYSLIATKAGYVMGIYGRSTPRGPSSQLELAEAERVTDLKIVMFQHAVISGRVTDEAGEPVVGVIVRALRRSSTAGRPAFSEALQYAQTDDRGIYRLSALEPDSEYVVAVPSISTTLPIALIDEALAGSRPGIPSDVPAAIFGAAPSFQRPPSDRSQEFGDQVLQVGIRAVTPPAPGPNGVLRIYPTTFYGQTSDGAEATVISLKPGEVRPGINIEARPVPSVRIVGRLESADGPPGPVSLTLLHTRSSRAPTAPYPVATGVADAQGNFTLLGVPPGQYLLRVWKERRFEPGDAMPRGGNARPVFQKPTLSALHPIAVGQRDLTDLRIPLITGFRVSGQIAFETDSQKIGLSRIYPFLEAFDAWIGTPFPEFSVSADGTFTSNEMPQGFYRLTVPVPAGYFVKSVTVQGREMADAAFELKEHLTGVVITLSERGAKVSGTVRDRTGKADAQASVLLFPADSRQWVDYSAYPRRIRDVGTRRDGSFSIGDLPSGDYLIVALPRTAVDWRPDFLEAMSKMGTRLTLSDAEQRSIDLRTAAMNAVIR